MDLKKIAHKLSSNIWRSSDIKFDDTVFSDFNLNADLLNGLDKSGFKKPSEIQLKAIPHGRLGKDLFIQSKSGTGKTCVFAVIVLDSIRVDSKSIQCLILVPTREIASQTHSVLKSFGAYIKGLKIRKFTGGLEVKKDVEALKECHVAIGTPGRIKYLIDSNHLKTNLIRTLVLDEADKLFDDKFILQINQIEHHLPSSKQTLLVSATATPNLFNYMEKNMKSFEHIKIDYESDCLTGVDQYYWNLSHLSSEYLEDNLFNNLIQILKKVSFTQCIIFSNSETRTVLFKPILEQAGWSTEVINGKLVQKQRDKIVKSMRNLDLKILLCTDLMARGIDYEEVNLVINLDVPNDLETYLHRVGRCGRFGQHGISITLCSNSNDFMHLNEIKHNLKGDLDELPDLDLVDDLWKFKNPNNSDLSIILDDLTRLDELDPNSKYLSFEQIVELFSNYELVN